MTARADTATRGRSGPAAGGETRADPPESVSRDGRLAHHPGEMKRALVHRLRRIEGQLRGIARMVEEDVYCDEVLNQITSVEAALNGARRQLLEAHIRGCVVEQILRGELDVVDELMRTIGRMVP